MFRPGQSGNPTGRPKVDKTIRDLARAHTQDALNTLIEIANNPKSQAAVRVQAANAILDRAWGKPAQYVESYEESIQKSLNYAMPNLDQDDLDERVLAFKNGTSRASTEEDEIRWQSCLK